MKRKAELWEQFVENYKEFAAEADEDVRRVIGKQLEQLYADEATRSRAKLNL
jgi:predicted component of type VI protein secretion system